MDILHRDKKNARRKRRATESVNYNVFGALIVVVG